jgi:hypothetical protein
MFVPDVSNRCAIALQPMCRLRIWLAPSDTKPVTIVNLKERNGEKQLNRAYIESEGENLKDSNVNNRHSVGLCNVFKDH